MAFMLGAAGSFAAWLMRFSLGGCLLLGLFAMLGASFWMAVRPMKGSESRIVLAIARWCRRPHRRRTKTLILVPAGFMCLFSLAAIIGGRWDQDALFSLAAVSLGIVIGYASWQCIGKRPFLPGRRVRLPTAIGFAVAGWLLSLSANHWANFTGDQSAMDSHIAWMRTEFDLVLAAIAGVKMDTATIITKEDESAEREKRLEEKVDQLLEKQAGEDPTLRQLTPDQRATVEEALEYGDKQTRTKAAIASGEYALADELLADLEKKKEAADFELFTMQGDRRYFAGEFDEAIAPYEKAFNLRPSDVGARNNLALALQQSRRTDIDATRRHAIEIYEGTLGLVSPKSLDWAQAQTRLGIAWWNRPSGDQGENIDKAIACYTAAQEVYTRATHPVEWATTQNSMGAAWTDRRSGDRGENIDKAIAYYSAALEVRTHVEHPKAWAETQHNLGNAWRERPVGNRAENIDHAIKCFNAALEVRTRTAQPMEWAMTSSNLGFALVENAIGDRGENIESAIKCYEAALEVLTRQIHPAEYAKTQNNLGNAWRKRPIGDRRENFDKAIACYSAAIEVHTRVAHPMDWAWAQNNLGGAWVDRPDGDRCENIEKGIVCFEAALKVRTRAAYPEEWAMTQNNLGNAHWNNPRGDRCANLRLAAGHYRAALEVWTAEAMPHKHPIAMRNLERVEAELKEMEE